MVEKRPNPYARRKWPWVAGAIGLAIVVTVGGIIVRNQSSSSPSAPLAKAEAALVSSGAVPSSVRADCSALRPLPAGADAAVACTPSEGVSRVSFSRYPTADSLNQAFDKRIQGSGVTRDSPDDCSSVVDVEHPYLTIHTISGNVACFHERGRSVLVWTMSTLSTLGVAERDDRQDQPLYDWWNIAYQVRIDSSTDPAALTDQQSALLHHVPESIRESCQSADLLQNATASLTCSSGSTDIYYTSYPDVDTMNAVYNAQQSAAGVAPDSLLATPGACPGEGPYRADAPDAGRILCYSDSGVARATWTDDQFSILSEAVRTDNQFAGLLTNVATLGPA